MSTTYLALIGDAVASRALPPPRRARLQRAFRGAIPEFNRRWRTALAARFAVTLGDEFQALLTTARPVWELLHEVHLRFPEVEWVVACGLGPIATRLERHATAPEVVSVRREVLARGDVERAAVVQLDDLLEELSCRDVFAVR